MEYSLQENTDNLLDNFQIHRRKLIENFSDSDSDNEFKEYICLGTFCQETSEIIVSDPMFTFEKNTYENIAWNVNVYLNNVKPGKWLSWIHVDEKTCRNSELISVYDSDLLDNDDYFMEYDSNKYEWELYEQSDIGVDSGMAGIYDLKYFRKDEFVNIPQLNLKKYDNDGEKWYNMNSYITQHDQNDAGIVPFGVVSMSGYGDGMYDLMICKNNDQIVGIKILFITNENRKMYEAVLEKLVEDDKKKYNECDSCGEDE